MKKLKHLKTNTIAAKHHPTSMMSAQQISKNNKMHPTIVFLLKAPKFKFLLKKSPQQSPQCFL